MPSMYVAIDDRKRCIVIEPSFPIIYQMGSRLENIHTLRGKIKVNGGLNRLVVHYTYGYEPHETLAAVIHTLTRELPNGACELTANDEDVRDIVRSAGEIADLMNRWYRLARAVRTTQALVDEIDARAERYDKDARVAASQVKQWRQSRDETSPAAYEFLTAQLDEAIAERRRIAANKRYDPKRKAKAEYRLAWLEVEIRALRPTYRKLVRPELQALV